MSQQDRQRLRYDILIQQSVDQQLNALVVDARQLVDGPGSDEAKIGVGPTQMSNLLNVCRETDSVQVVIGYVQYQIGRDNRRRNWAIGGFGEGLIKRLDGLKSQAVGIVGAASKVYAPPDRNTAIDHVWMLLVRQYVGHLRRYLTYKRPSKEEGE